ncbi:MFS transporter [Sphingomonas glacialis]|nr:MFS transporter [Sphingomonas glacialis]
MAVLIGIAATFGNALVTVNLPVVAGANGIDLVAASWLSSVFIAFNASGNLLLVRSRITWGIPAVTRTLLILYILAALIEIAYPGFATALGVRAISGLAATGLTTLAIYHLLQIFRGRLQPIGLCIGMTLPQFGTPLARLVPVELLAAGQWHGLQLVEIASALLVLAMTTALPLPPSRRGPAFEPLDFVTIGLLLPGLTLLCVAVGAGRYAWWTDTPWIGASLAAAIFLLISGMAIEHFRARPLIQTRWLATRDILRLVGVALMVRFALAEQTYGAVGLLGLGGLNNDQLHGLFVVIAIAMAGGSITAAVTLSERRLPYQVAIAALLIAAGAWIDSGASNLTRPGELYASQAMLGFGACLFLGPALLYGLLRVLKLGPNYLVSLIVVFSISQNVGGLIGSAFLGTYQVIQSKAHAAALAEHLVVGDVPVAQRLSAQGIGGLYQALQREASVLAFDDVFRLVAVIALGIAVWVILVTATKRHAASGT